jgi:hypothetical protein
MKGKLMSIMTLQLEIDALTQASTVVFKALKRKDSNSLKEIAEGIGMLRSISRQIEEKEALIKQQRPLAEWEKELLGM